MSEKKEVGLNEIDMQAVIATWIVANNRCGVLVGIDCAGEAGLFKGTGCPLFGQPGRCGSSETIVKEMKEWLSKYHYRKSVDAAEAEKRKVEAAKKEEPRKICGICRHVPVNIIDLGDVQRTVPCEKKGINVPAYLEGCHEFESRTATDQPRYVFAKDGMDNAAYVERISQLENENANLADKCERLTEQQNRLSNSLIEMTIRVKEVEQESDILAKKLVDCTAKWNDLSGVCVEKDSLIDRLRNANSRSIGEVYRMEAELKDEQRRKKEIEEENGALRSKLEQVAEDRKHELRRTIEIEGQLSKALSDQWFRKRCWVTL